MAFISGCVRFLRVSVEGNHIVLGRLQVRRAGSASRWFAVALTAATVAACAQAPVVANKPSSFDTGRHASVAAQAASCRKLRPERVMGVPLECVRGSGD